MRKIALLIASAIGLGACSTNHPLIPDKSLYLKSGHAISLSGVVAAATIIGSAYLIYDPLAPNWEIEEVRMSDDTFRLSMMMKRFHTGGAGEAYQAFKRRASQLQEQLGYGQYLIAEYQEGIDSQTLGARRVANGVIRLTHRLEADSFNVRSILH